MKKFTMMVAIAFAAGAPAAAADFGNNDLQSLNTAALARVRPGMVAHFYDCPDKMTRDCERKAYVRGGDLVVIRDAPGPLVNATFSDGRHLTDGWLPRAALVNVATPAAGTAAWLGKWSEVEKNYIVVKPGNRPGTLAFTGQSIWESRGGGQNVGEIGDESDKPKIGVPRSGYVQLGDLKDQNACQLKMRLMGPYLVVIDNYKCGGFNVSFKGLYRHIG